MWHVKVGEKVEPSNFNRVEQLKIGVSLTDTLEKWNYDFRVY